ncbi:MAG TPA: hypothetical protein IAB40_07010 [Candidatus Onthocola stercoravium]|nr:hypothetical protein [Candidatus Onthocola stercoravium]
MENLKTKQDVMLDKINETKTLLRKTLFYSVKKKILSNKDIQEIKIQIMIERIANILSNVYYEAILDVKKADFRGEALDDFMVQMNSLLKVLLVNALTTKDGVSMWEQVLAHYEEEPDELTKMAGVTLLALPDEQKNALSQANFYMENIENVCDNAQDIINAHHKKFMEEEIMPFVTAASGTLENGVRSLDLLPKIPNFTFRIDGIKALLLATELMYKVHKAEYEPMLKRYKQANCMPGRK